MTSFFKRDVEGSVPNITLSLNLLTNGPPLKDTVIRHFVTSSDTAMLMSSSAEPLDDSVYNGPYKFPFILPSDSFNLCYHTYQLVTSLTLVIFDSSSRDKNTSVVERV